MRALVVDPGQLVNFRFLKNHNVVEVFSEADFDSCNFGQGRILSGHTATVTAATQDTDYTFVAPQTVGTVFLVCGVGTHCTSMRQKVAITVSTTPLSVWQQLITLRLDSSEAFADRQSAFIEALARRYQYPAENIEVVAVNSAVNNRRIAAGPDAARPADVDIMIWGPSAEALSFRLQQDLQQTQFVIDQFSVQAMILPGRPISTLRFGPSYTFDCDKDCRAFGCEVRPRGSGTLPASVSLLSCQSRIGTLNFTDVPSFRGKIPQTIINLRNLQNLAIVNASFTGPLPQWISKLRSVTNLWIVNTAFSGILPPLPRSLQRVRIAGVNFSGTFQINDLTSLKGMYIENVNFTGPLPDFGDLKSLEFLYIASVRFSGPLPSSLADLSAISELTIQETAIGGVLPAIGGKHHFKVLNLKNNLFTGRLPASLFHSPAVQDFKVPWEEYGLFPQKCPTDNEHRVGFNYSLARFGEAHPMANFGYCESNPVLPIIPVFQRRAACLLACKMPRLTQGDGHRFLVLKRDLLGKI
jgi:hypothetical protein